MATPLLKRRRRERARRALAVYQQRAPTDNRDPAFWLSDRLLGMGGGLSAPYKQSTWVYAAASWIAQNGASVPFKLLSGSADDPSDVTAGPWFDLFQNPNPEHPVGEFWELTLTWLMLPPGEVFWIKTSSMGEPIRTPTEVPSWLWPSSGSEWRPLKDKRTGALLMWEQRKGNTIRKYEPHQVAHMRLPNPDDPLRGQSPMEAARRSVRTDEKAEAWNEAVLDNGAEPGTVWKIPGISPEQVPGVRRQIEDRHGGPRRANRTAILNHKDADVIKTGMTHTEMGFSQQREWARQEVASAYKLPLFVLSVLGDVHRETSREALKLAWTSGVIPHLTRIEGALKAQLFDGVTWGVFDIATVKVLARDENERRDMAVKDAALGIPLEDVNTRHDLGYEVPDAEEGESWATGLVPLNQIPRTDAAGSVTPDLPADSALAPVADVVASDQEVEVSEDLVLNGAQIQAALAIVLSVATGEIPRDSGIGQLVVLFNLTTQQAEQIMGSAGTSTPTTPNPNPATEPEPTGPVPPQFAGGGDDDEEDEETEEERGFLERTVRWHEFIRQLFKPAEDRMRTRLTGYFFRRRKEVLRFLEEMDSRLIEEAEECYVRVGGPHPIKGAFLFDGEEIPVDDVRSWERKITNAEFGSWLDEQQGRWDDLLAQDTAPITRQVVSGQLDRLEAATGGLAEANMAHPRVLRFMEEMGARKGRFVNRTLSDMLKETMREALTPDAEGKIPTIEGISKRVKETFNVERNQARTIARTEVGAAANGSMMEFYDIEGITKHSWLTARDGNVRDTHQIDGETVPVGQSFSNGLMMPQDPGAPAEEVINCRCTTVPEV